MAEQAQAKKAAPKRKTAARKAPAKTTAKRKSAPRKTAARKTAARNTAARKAPTLQSRVTEVSRSAFLASLGFYGMAFDEAEKRFKTVEGELAARRKKADKLYADMVKRGEKVEKQARSLVDDLDVLKFDAAKLDRAALEAQLEKARARFEELKQTVGNKVQSVGGKVAA
jgi:polyhydroxyalkanoate synthesis regulator phasin